MRQPKILVSINKIAVQAILDTGATVSVINEDSLPNNSKINPEGFKGVLQGINSKITVVGTVSLNISITDTIVLFHEFVVVKKCFACKPYFGDRFSYKHTGGNRFPK